MLMSYRIKQQKIAYFGSNFENCGEWIKYLKCLGCNFTQGIVVSIFSTSIQNFCLLEKKNHEGKAFARATKNLFTFHFKNSQIYVVIRFKICAYIWMPFAIFTHTQHAHIAGVSNARNFAIVRHRVVVTSEV